MKKLKLNKAERKKPLGVGLEGQLLAYADVVERKTPMTSLATLDYTARKRLVLDRTQMEDDFDIERLGGARLNKRQLMSEIETGSEVGEWYVDAEISYLIDLQAKIAGEFSAEGRLLPRYSRRVDPSTYQWVPREFRPYMLRRTAVFTESDHDSITTSGSNFRKANVHPRFVAKGFGTVSLTGSTNVRSTFETEIKDWSVTYTSGIGHGSPSRYTGNAGSNLWQVGSYDASEPAGKIVHLLSCLTAQILGPDLVANGANAYFGYHPSFYINWSYPDQFWVCDSAIDYGFALGMTASEVHDLTLYVYNSMITTMTGVHAPTAAVLTGDRDGLRTPVSGSSYGKKNATVNVFPFFARMRADIARFEPNLEIPEETLDLEAFVDELTRIR